MNRYVFLIPVILFTFSSCASKKFSLSKHSNDKDIANSRLTLQDSVLNFGLTYLNTPYRYGASGPNSFDCSGFTSFVYSKFGYTLKHGSGQQAEQIANVNKSKLKKGDLIFFEGRRRNGKVGHVGIVYEIKDNNAYRFLHASTSSGVIVSSSDEPYYASRFLKGGRIITENEPMWSAKQDSKNVTSKLKTEENTAVSNETLMYHVVKKGENLFEISQMYDVPVETLKKLNLLKNNKIKKGVKLKLRDTPQSEIGHTTLTTKPVGVIFQDTAKGTKTVNDTNIQKLQITIKADSTATSVQKKQTTTNAKEIYHTVKQGETLYAIAKTYSLTVEELKEQNNLISDEISIGQALKTNLEKQEIPTTWTYVVKKGDTLYSIGKKYNCSAEQIKSWNNLGNKPLQVGYKLILHNPL